MGSGRGVSRAIGLALSVSLGASVALAGPRADRGPEPAPEASGAAVPSAPVGEAPSPSPAAGPAASPGEATRAKGSAPPGPTVAPVATSTDAAAEVPGQAPGQAPSAVATRFNRELLDVLRRSDALGYEGRFERLRHAIAVSFDLDFMAEKSLGRRWKELSEEDRRRWREAFTELVAATYAGRFHGYRGQHFETRAEEAGPHETALVATRLVDPKGDDVDITYRLRRADGGWRVCDVYLEGTVSELALRRSEFASVLDRQGVDALFAAVRKKIDSLRAGEGG